MGEKGLEQEEEPDIVVDEKEVSIDQVNENLPDGVYIDEDGQKVVAGEEEYDLIELVTQIKSAAKKRGPATYALTIGGVTLGLLISGPFGGVAIATVAGLIGALYDKGYIDFDDGKIRLTIGDEAEYIDPEELKVDDPFEMHEDKWYEPDSDNSKFAVELPNGDKRYYKTREAAGNRLVEEYGS